MEEIKRKVELSTPILIVESLKIKLKNILSGKWYYEPNDIVRRGLEKYKMIAGKKGAMINGCEDREELYYNPQKKKLVIMTHEEYLKMDNESEKIEYDKIENERFEPISKEEATNIDWSFKTCDLEKLEVK